MSCGDWQLFPFPMLPNGGLLYILLLGLLGKFRKIPIISPELYLFNRLFCLGIFSGELIFGGSCHRKEF